MAIEELASRVKEKLGLSWKSIVICCGSICSWILLGGNHNPPQAFIFLNISLQWLGINDWNATIIEQYIQQHMTLFISLAMILFTMVAFFHGPKILQVTFLKKHMGRVSYSISSASNSQCSFSDMSGIIRIADNGDAVFRRETYG